MIQRIVCGHGHADLNEKLEVLRKDYLITITHLSTCPAPEKYSRYDTAITVVVDLYKPISEQEGGRL